MVSIAGITSNARPGTSGIIQGSLLVPLLLLVYVNGALTSVLHVVPWLSADDTKYILLC